MNKNQRDYGLNPYVTNVERDAMKNSDFRTAIWTGEYAQMTIMCIPSCGDIGLEMHADTDQIIRVEQGCGVVMMGKKQCEHDFEWMLNKGDVIFVPAGTWHNIINTGKCTLKVSSVYAPPKHPRGTIHHTKADAAYHEESH